MTTEIAGHATPERYLPPTGCCLSSSAPSIALSYPPDCFYRLHVERLNWPVSVAWQSQRGRGRLQVNLTKSKMSELLKDGSMNPPESPRLFSTNSSAIAVEFFQRIA